MDERRRHPRYELFTSVRVPGGDETVVLYTRNISLGGVALATDGTALSQWPVGSLHELLIFDVADETVEPLRATGMVVRQSEEGIALMWSGDDPPDAQRLARLFEGRRPIP